MPAFETMDRYQTATLWPKVAGSSSLGQPVVSSSPSEIKVRWDDRQTERLDSQGNSITVDATVVVAQEIAIGSVMRLGTISDWAGTGSGERPAGLMLVKMYDETPDILNRNIRRTVSLMRYNDDLPTS